MSIYQRPAPLRSGPRIVHPPAAPRSRSARLSGCAGSPFEHRAQPVAYCPALLLSREERCEDPPGDPKPSAPLCSSCTRPRLYALNPEDLAGPHACGSSDESSPWRAARLYSRRAKSAARICLATRSSLLCSPRRSRLESPEKPAAYYPALLLSREERCEDPPGDPNPSALLSSSCEARGPTLSLQMIQRSV
ncbi:hypothetical protein ACG7TL_006171 [Trametes sanguinea]